MEDTPQTTPRSVSSLLHHKKEYVKCQRTPSDYNSCKKVFNVNTGNETSSSFPIIPSQLSSRTRPDAPSSSEGSHLRLKTLPVLFYLSWWVSSVHVSKSPLSLVSMVDPFGLEAADGYSFASGPSHPPTHSLNEWTTIVTSMCRTLGAPDLYVWLEPKEFTHPHLYIYASSSLILTTFGPSKIKSRIRGSRRLDGGRHPLP